MEILIVEDSQTQAEQLKYLLEQNNCMVTHAINGKQALILMEKFIPDLIISDIIMPEMDGYELCKRIREHEKLKNIPVILLTSLSDPEDVLKGLTFGADNFFTKPCQEDYLISHIQEIIEHPKTPNVEHHRDDVEIFFNGKKRQIKVNQTQLLTLLLSTYEAAVMQNKRLVQTQVELQNLNENLEEMVEERTQELKLNQQKYQDLYDNAPAMFMSVEYLTGKVVECNETLLRKTGFKRSEVIGKHIYSRYHPDCIEIAKKNFQLFNESGEIINSEAALVTEQGGRVEVLISSTAVRDDWGKILYSRSVIQDISEVKQAQEELKQSEERYRAVADTAVDSIITIDTKGIIVGWNQGAAETFGFNEHEIKGLSISRLIPDEYELLFNRLQKGGLPHLIGKTVELQGIRKNGAIFPIEISMAQWQTSSNQFYTGIIRDITVRKIAEEELFRAKEKAVESDNLKTAFLANMSHEIRTPMNAILGFSELLNDPDLDDQDKKLYITTINQASRQLLHIITDIVDISKIEAGQEATHPEVFNLNDLLEEIKIFFEPQAKRKNLKISLHKNIPAELSDIRSDPKKLRQILNNIIENAIKFTKTGVVDIKVEPRNHQLSFSITDSGIGIDASLHVAIFDRFRQAELSYCREYGGTGLGLSLAKSYVEMMGGTIRVDSSPGNGSTFMFEIPWIPAVSKPIELTEEKKEPALLPWKGLTMLLAEDEEVNSFYIQTILKSTGIKIITAINGLEAVEQCKINDNISLVLMDIKMPKMDGMTATQIIKSFRINLPIIATTAYALSSDREKCIEAGCNDYLPKPIKKDQLMVMMNRYLS